MATITNSICTSGIEVDLQSQGGALNIATQSTATVVTICNATGSSGIVLNSGSSGTVFNGFAEGALITSSTGKVSTITGTVGYVLTANASGTAPSFQPASGGGGGITWNDQTSSPVTMVANNAYVVDDTSNLVTFTLPATAALGATFQIAGYSSGCWTITVASGQIINFGSMPTTVTTGSLSSTNRYDQVTITCVVANTTFVVTSSVGNLTVV